MELPSSDDTNAQTPAPTKQLSAASNPALRLQELLRREAEEAGKAPVAEPAVPLEEPLVAESMVTSAEPVTPTVHAYDAPPAAPAPPVAPAPAPAPRLAEPVILIVVVNSERHTPVEYPNEDAMPTILSLEEAHRAFLLSDEWQRRGPVRIRTIRMRRRRL